MAKGDVKLDRYYVVERLNIDANTVTVTMVLTDQKLQQDVPVENFDSKDAILAAVEQVFAKFSEDVAAIPQQKQPAKEVTAMVGQSFEVK